MIESLSIQNFKGINSSGVEFQKISRVNYFVGENGSGKSSVLDFIFQKYSSETVMVKDDLSAVEFWRLVGFNQPIGQTEGAWWKSIFETLLNRKLVILNLLPYLINFNKNSKKKYLLNPKITFEAIKILEDLDIIISNQNQSESIDNEQFMGGEKKLLHIVCGILIAVKTLNCKIFTFDEPEIHLHPSWQKKLPDVFGYICEYLDVQIFVATHSPFIISSVGGLSEQEINATIYNPDQIVTQKVYFLKDGQVADKHGLITSYGAKGYSGRGVSYITSRMLGVGLMDFITNQKIVQTKNAPKLVLCEGEGQDQDAEIYNIIFRDLEPNVLFVSCRGSTQLHKTFRLLKEIKPGLSANFEIIMVRDRDHEYPTIEDINQYQLENEGCKVLHRRAIEAYLYNSETARLVLKQFGQKLEELHKERMDNLQDMIAISSQQGIPGNIYKSELEQMFNQITLGLTRQIKNKGTNNAEKIAWLINPRTKIYKELYKQIFS